MKLERFKLLLFILGFALFTTVLEKVTLHSATMFANFKYRMPIYINNTGNQSVENATILLTINTQELINAGKMRPDCADIRFSYYSGDEEIKVPYYLYQGCGTPNTKIFVKVPYLPQNGTVTLYMYYGNPQAESESNESVVGNGTVINIGKYFEEHTLQGAYYAPNTRDIYDYYWSDAGRDAFDGYARTYLYQNTNPSGNRVAINIRPYDVFGERYRLQTITLPDGRKFIVYKDMLPSNKGQNSVLRIVILPTENSVNTYYSIYRYGNLGSDGSTHSASYTFTCNGRNYRFYMTWDYNSNPGRGDPNIFYFMFCSGENNINGVGRYETTRSGDNLYEKLYSAKGVCVLYLAPTDNNLNDQNIRNFLCEEIQYFDQFKDAYFEVDDQGNLIAYGIVDYYRDVSIQFGREERYSLTPDVYQGIDLRVPDSYEHGETITIYAVLKTNETPVNVSYEILSFNGTRVYGPAPMNKIDSLTYSAQLNSSLLQPGTYLVRVLVLMEDNSLYGGAAPIKIHTQFAQLKQYINERTNQILDYLQNTIYPLLEQINTTTHDLYTYDYYTLMELNSTLTQVKYDLAEFRTEVENVNATLYNKLSQVEYKVDEIHNKVNIILDLINNVVLLKLDSMDNKLNQTLNYLDLIDDKIDYNVLPQLRLLQNKVERVYNMTLELNDTIDKGFKDVNTQIQIVQGELNDAMIILNQIYNDIGCSSQNPSNESVCMYLRQIQSNILSLQQDVDSLTVIVNNIDTYLRDVLTPKVDDIYTVTQTILDNQNATYNLLAQQYQEVMRIKNETATIYAYLRQLDTSISSQFVQVFNKIDSVNETLYSKLEQMRVELLNSIATANNNLNQTLTMLQQIQSTLNCETNAEICALLDDANRRLAGVRDDIETMKEDIEKLRPLRSDIEKVLEELDTVYNELSQLSGDVKDIKKILQGVRATQEELAKIAHKTTGVQIVIPQETQQQLSLDVEKLGNLVTIVSAIILALIRMGIITL